MRPAHPVQTGGVGERTPRHWRVLARLSDLRGWPVDAAGEPRSLQAGPREGPSVQAGRPSRESDATDRPPRIPSTRGSRPVPSRRRSREERETRTRIPVGTAIPSRQSAAVRHPSRPETLSFDNTDYSDLMTLAEGGPVVSQIRQRTRRCGYSTRNYHADSAAISGYADGTAGVRPVLHG